MTTDLASGATDRAPVGMLCRCPASEWPHRHLDSTDPVDKFRRRYGTDTVDAREWRALAREDHEAAKAQLLKEIFK